VRRLVDDVEFLNGDLIDLVKHVDARDVDAVAFDDIDKLVYGSVFSEGNVAIGKLIFGTD